MCLKVSFRFHLANICYMMKSVHCSAIYWVMISCLHLDVHIHAILNFTLSNYCYIDAWQIANSWPVKFTWHQKAFVSYLKLATFSFTKLGSITVSTAQYKLHCLVVPRANVRYDLSRGDQLLLHIANQQVLWQSDDYQII